MFSYSQNNIYGYAGAAVSYSSVLESYGENFESGGIEHKYTAVADQLGTSYLGDNIIGAPFSSHSWENGREYYQQIFKKVDSSYIPVKKTYSHFRDDSRADSTIYAYMVNKKYSPVCTAIPPLAHQLNAYDLFQYSIFKKWSYVDTVRTLTYDENGQYYVEDTTTTEYANSSHAFPTRISSRGSDGKLNIVNTYYPEDLSLSGTAETGRLALVAAHITNPKLQVQVKKDTVQTFKATTNYNVFSNGLILPKEEYVQTRNNHDEKRVEFFKYNSAGKLLEQSKSNDYKANYIWDYNSLYPVAEVKNADSASIAATSFEDNDKGGWTFLGTPAIDYTCPTGKQVYVLNGSNDITKSGLNSSTIYTVSYWRKNVSPYSIPGTMAGYPIAGRTVDGWTLFEHRITGQSTITISGTGSIDELRLCPATAQMSTYCYSPLIGLTSQCDANNRITYYEYDKLGRLSLIRDQDKKVIKKICYNYAGQPEDCSSGYFANVLKTGSFTKNDCGSGRLGTVVIDSVLAGTYTSPFGQAYVDSLAQADVTANGQANANAKGSCVCDTLVCTPSDPSHKCVNGSCESGTAICVSSVLDFGSGLWVCTWYYFFSDCSSNYGYVTYTSGGKGGGGCTVGRCR